MADTYVGAIDQGTTGTRFMVFDPEGQVVANAYEQHEQIYPESGWVEHDPVEIWENTKDVVTRGLENAALDATQLEAIGITNQRETTIVWDKGNGRPVHNALVWQDRRTTDRVEELEEEDKVETKSLRVDGGAVKNDFLCQLQSDIIQTDIERPEVDETTALGSAYAAGLAVGYWDSTDELRENWQIDREFSSEMDEDDADAMYDRWGDAVERSLDWAQEEGD